MISLLEKSQCSGCTAWQFVCPEQCISMKADDECGNEHQDGIIGSPPHVKEVTGTKQKQIAEFLRRERKVDEKDDCEKIKKFNRIENHIG